MVKLHVVIDPKTGRVEYEIEGIAGGKCTDLTKVMQAGHEVEEEQLTEEYYTPSEMPAYIEDI